MEKGSRIYSREIGMEGLVNKKKPGIPLSKYANKKI